MKTTKADEKALLEAESRYCSYGDTVHYLEPAKLFAGCNGSFLYDYEDKPYLDLQMWYSAVNFGYANPRLNDALKRQIDTLPQVASQYLHKEKIELAAMLCESIKDAWGEEGRVHFNVGGSQAIEDSLKLVRNACGGKSLMIAFEGGYHGRTLGASSITSSYRYRRRYGHFGLTHDRVDFPRRRARLSLEELIAGTLILYPSYYDWQTKGFCTPEDICHRLTQPKGQMRGKFFMRTFAALREKIRNVF